MCGCKLEKQKWLNNTEKSRGEGIRTPETLLFTRFPSVRLKPLGHPSVYIV